jgi:hypothetical protein
MKHYDDMATLATQMLPWSKCRGAWRGNRASADYVTDGCLMLPLSELRHWPSIARRIASANCSSEACSLVWDRHATRNPTYAGAITDIKDGDPPLVSVVDEIGETSWYDRRLMSIAIRATDADVVRPPVHPGRAIVLRRRGFAVAILMPYVHTPKWV